MLLSFAATDVLKENVSSVVDFPIFRVLCAVLVKKGGGGDTDKPLVGWLITPAYPHPVIELFTKVRIISCGCLGSFQQSVVDCCDIVLEMLIIVGDGQS